MSERALSIPNRLFIAQLFISLILILITFTLPLFASVYIVSDLGGDRTLTSYALAFFGCGSALTTPIAKPLSARYGIERVYIACLILFAFTTFLCAMAPTYFLFIVARFLEGMSTGLFYPLMAHCFQFTAGEKKQSLIAWIFGTILIVCPVLGGALGGTVAYLYSWRAPFIFIALLILALTFCIERQFKKALPPIRSQFDWISWIFYAVALATLSFAIICAQQLDWYRSSLFITACVIGTICLLYFVLRTFLYKQSIFNFKLFKKPYYALIHFSLFIIFGLYFGLLVLLSIWLTLDVQFSPLWIAILLSYMAIAGLFPFLILEQKFGKIDTRFFLLLAICCLIISCFYTSVFNPEINLGRIAFSRILAGFGFALFLPPCVQILARSYPPDVWVDTMEFFQSIRSVSCGLGAAIFSIIWQRRTVFYHERLNETLNAQNFLTQFETLHVPGNPYAQLNEYLNKEASSLALNDVFYLMGWILTGLLIIHILTLFFKISPKQ